MNKNSRKRPDLLPAKLGELTQGTVFSGVTVERYLEWSLYGVCITARCDLAQNKYQVLNYLPLVPLDAWLLIDGLDLLVSEQLTEYKAAIKNRLKSSGISESIINSVPLTQIADEFFPMEGKTKKSGQTFRNSIKDLESFEKLVASDDRTVMLNWFKDHKSKRISTIISRLFRHDISGYYMFEHLLPEDSDKTFVCILREVLFFPNTLAELIKNGVDEDVLKNNNLAELAKMLKLDDNDMAYPVVCIGSPTIEHLMQSFSFLFSRIGLADPESSRIKAVTDESLRNGVVQ